MLGFGRGYKSGELASGGELANNRVEREWGLWLRGFTLVN